MSACWGSSINSNAVSIVDEGPPPQRDLDEGRKYIRESAETTVNRGNLKSHARSFVERAKNTAHAAAAVAVTATSSSSSSCSILRARRTQKYSESVAKITKHKAKFLRRVHLYIRFLSISDVGSESHGILTHTIARVTQGRASDSANNSFIFRDSVVSLASEITKSPSPSQPLGEYIYAYVTNYNRRRLLRSSALIGHFAQTKSADDNDGI